MNAAANGAPGLSDRTNLCVAAWNSRTSAEMDSATKNMVPTSQRDTGRSNMLPFLTRAFLTRAARGSSTDLYRGSCESRSQKPSHDCERREEVADPFDDLSVIVSQGPVVVGQVGAGVEAVPREVGVAPHKALRGRLRVHGG